MREIWGDDDALAARLEQAAVGGDISPTFPLYLPHISRLEQTAVGGGAHAVHVRAGRRAAVLGVRLGDIGVATRRHRGDNYVTQGW